jgi:hypothetical protein
MKSENKYTRKIMTWFLVGSIAIFLISLSFLLYFAITAVQGDFGSYTSVSNLFISFVACISTAFFSLATFRNGSILERNSITNELNRYIIENYSLINFCTEITIVKENENGYNKEIFGEILENKSNENLVSTNICFLVTDYINKPIYKVLFKEIEFVSAGRKFFSEKGIDGKYQEHTLSRDYNCMGLNLPLNIEETKQLFQEDTKIKITLNIISIFNVQFTVYYEIGLSDKKDVSNNPDTKKFKDLETYRIHHSIYRVEKQEVVER